LQVIDEGTTLNLLAATARRPRGVEITMAHLHLGSEGENGPVIANLLNDGNFKNSRRLRRLKTDIDASELVSQQ